VAPNEINLNQEFQDFLSATETAPQASVSNNILSLINGDLNPSFQKVFMKVLGIHSVTSLLSLSLCSQFGIRTFSFFDLMHTFMKMTGPTICLALCGALYLGLSSLMISLFLSPEEVRKIRLQKGLQITLLSGASLGVFLCLGAEMLFLPMIFWFVGSLSGGIVTLEVGWLLRSQFRKRLIFGS
jgi:hypothetical protein